MSPVIRAADARRSDGPEASSAALATPSLGTTEHVVAWMQARAGYRIAPHVHDREEIVLILAGSATVTLDGEETAVGKGDVVAIPAGTVAQFAVHDDGFEILTVKPPNTRYFDPDGSELAPPALLA